MTLDLTYCSVLTADEEISLARRIEAGVYADHLLHLATPYWASQDELQAVRRDGEAAWQCFYVGNLRLASMVAHRWANRYRVDVDDVMQECCLTLGGAIQAWDCRRGNRFSTLAWPRLTMAAQEACLQRLGGGVSPIWWLRANSQVRTLAQDNAMRGCVDPTQATAEDVSRSPEWVRRALAWNPPRHLTPADESLATLETGTSAEDVWAGLRRLDRLERSVVELRFGIRDDPPASYKQIAKQLQLSPRAVKRAETRALADLAEVYDLAIAA